MYWYSRCTWDDQPPARPHNDGKIHHVLYDHEQLEPGVHDLALRVNVLDWPEGRYAIRAHSNNEAGARLMNFQL